MSALVTFRPVSVDNLEEHEMHSEYYQFSQEATDTLNQVKAKGGRVVAVGTTSIRTLETIGNKFDGQLQADAGWTNIFIKPGYDFKVVDAFSTNFHLPKSTLVCWWLPLQAVILSWKPIVMRSKSATASSALAMPCFFLKRRKDE